MTKEYRESFVNGEQEPWCFQGGLQAEFQVCIAVCAARQACIIHHMAVQTTKTGRIYYIIAVVFASLSQVHYLQVSKLDILTRILN